MHGPSPPQIVGGPSPQSALGLRPCPQVSAPVYKLIHLINNRNVDVFANDTGVRYL